MDGHSNGTIRYASEEDRRKAETLAASLDAAMEEYRRNGPATAADIARVLRELDAEEANETPRAKIG